MAATLRADKLAELKEFNRIITLATDANADLFAALKVPHHFRKENQPCPIPLPDNFEIDFHCNYYKEFASNLSINCPMSSIESAWKNRWRKMSPVADIGGINWRNFAQDPVAQYTRKKEFEKLCTAYNVLRNPVYRAKYDDGRVLGFFATEKATKKAAESMDWESTNGPREIKDQADSAMITKDDINALVAFYAQGAEDKINNSSLPKNDEPAEQSLPLPIESMTAKIPPNEQAVDGTRSEMTSPRKRPKLSPSNGYYVKTTTPRNYSSLLPKELTREEIGMRDLVDLEKSMDQEAEAEHAGNRNLQVANSEGERKYIYVKDMEKNRYVKVLRKS